MLSSPIDEEIEINDAEDRLRQQRTQAHSLHFLPEEKTTRTIDDLMPCCILTPESCNLAICLYLDIKDNECQVMESLMVMLPISQLKLEEALLSEEFGFINIAQARREFLLFMLTKMRKEAKLFDVDLKLFYLKKVDPYNLVVPEC